MTNTTTMDDLRNQLQAMLDKTEDKETIEQLGTMNSLLDKLAGENQKLQDEQKEILKDYKELVKHTSFTPNGKETEEVVDTKPLTFDEFLKNYKKE